MNGARSLIRTLVDCGVEACFANPGTSEMHFVAALDTAPEMRGVLCLFEGCVTGAADGYARMAGKPAVTLLHLGPGLGNGIANLHNARKARSPMVNVVGDHAVYHRQYESPLNSDVEAIARPISAWVRTSMSAATVGQDAADAVAAATRAPGQIATLILPADTAWTEGGTPGTFAPPPPPPAVDDAAIARAVDLLRRPGAILLLNGAALLEEGAMLAAAIGAATGAEVRAQGPSARITRGAGRVPIDRVPNPIEMALKVFAKAPAVVLLGATPPVAFFAYPGLPSLVTPPDCEVFSIASPDHDVMGTLRALTDAVSADPGAVQRQPRIETALPSGAITPEKLAAAIAALIPEGAIITDESVTTGRAFFSATLGAAPHDWLQLTGGAIGSGIPMAIGAAVACPDRKVINFESDGSAMFTIQGLWTQARENMNVLTVIWANRAYNILRNELKRVGADTPGKLASGMLSLDNPAISFADLARSLGVDACQVEDMESFTRAFSAATDRQGPYLIEVMLQGAGG